MNTLKIENANREFVWTINKNEVSKPVVQVQKTKKEPVLIKELIEKALNRLSLQLLDKITVLEDEVSKLRDENSDLRLRLNHVQKIA